MSLTDPRPPPAPLPVTVTSPDPMPVSVTNPEPLDVHVTNPAPARGPTGLPIQSQQHDPSLPARTTFQQDLTHAGQRQVNLIWETTQGRIALGVITGTMVIDGLAILMSILLQRELSAATGLSLGFVNSLATGVVSFYFSRTNHTQIGGVGDKPNEEYRGR